MTDLKFMYKEDMVNKYGYKFDVDIENFDYDGNDWEIFLDKMRGVTFVESMDNGYVVQEISTWS